MNIALVADWLPTFAGAEHVIAEFYALWPKAPLHTSVAAHGHIGPLDAADVRTSPLQKYYKILGNHKVLLPWMPRTMEGIDLQGYDVVLSSSHAVGKGVIPSMNALHVCYCHTPMRYAWEMEKEYLEDFHVPKMLRKKVRTMLRDLRRWDLTTAKRVDVFVANSTTIQERIQRTYGRNSIVLHPPVRDSFFDQPLVQKEKTYFLAIGRLVPYKRFDLLIEAANAKQIPLKIAGTGQDEKRLKAMAGPTVEMLGFVPDEQLSDLYMSAKALLFPQHEDAGVVPLEAQACGTPVIAYGKGGALDTVQDGHSGLFFDQQNTAALISAIDRFESLHFDAEAIREHAKQFKAERFRTRMKQIVEEAYKEKMTRIALEALK